MSEEGGIDRAEMEKRTAGLAAVDLVVSGMTLGLGTGSTVKFFLEGLAEALRNEDVADIRGVPTSVDTEHRCEALGIPTMDLSEGVTLDLAVDGADEVSPDMDLIKGLGGALLREKVVVQAASRFVVIVDSSKEVRVLGEQAPVPVEVAPFGWSTQLPFFVSLGAQPTARRGTNGAMVRTDNGNYLIDLEFRGGIASPVDLEAALRARAGIVETGLFLQMADRVLVGTADGVKVRERALV